MKSRRPSYFSLPTTPATSREPSCLWMAASRRSKPSIEENAMTIRRVELERVSVKSSKPLDKIVAALEAEVGHPDIGEFFRDTNNARTFAELETVVYRSLGPTELMIFMKLDQGAVLRKET